MKKLIKVLFIVSVLFGFSIVSATEGDIASVTIVDDSQTEYFSTLDAAIEYAMSNDGSTVKLLKAAECSTQLRMQSFSKVHNITVDLGGYTLLKPGGGILLAVGGQTRALIKNGKINASILIQNTSELVLEAVEMECTSNVVNVDSEDAKLMIDSDSSVTATNTLGYAIRTKGRAVINGRIKGGDNGTEIQYTSGIMDLEDYSGSAIRIKPRTTRDTIDLSDILLPDGFGIYNEKNELLNNSGIVNYLIKVSKLLTAPAITKAPAAKELTYNGQNQVLVSAPEIEGGIMMYSLEENGEYTSNIPEAKNAGAYKVWYYVLGDDEHYDSEKACVDVVIKKAELIVRAKNKTIVFGDLPDNDGAEYSGFVGGEDEYILTGTLQFSYNYNQNDDVGVYSIKPSGQSAANYNISFETGELTVEALDIQGAVITLKEALTYNGQEQEQLIESVRHKGFDVTYTISDNKATNHNGNGNYTLWVEGNGNFKGRASCEWNIARVQPVVDMSKELNVTVALNTQLDTVSMINNYLYALDGTTLLEGSFEWLEPNTIITANSVERVKFIPADNNYATVEADVKVQCRAGGGSGITTTRFTVKFDSNGGSEVAAQTVTVNKTIYEPEEPTRSGYSFEGWYTDRQFKKKFNFEAKIARNYTLYAKWSSSGSAADDVDEQMDVDNTEENKDTSGDGEWINPFTDVDKNDWFYADVGYAVKNGLFSGMNEWQFAPNMPITRGMLVTAIWRMEGKPVPAINSTFGDVHNAAYYAEAVAWGQENEIVKGYSETEFAPDQNITREQMAAIIYRYAEYKSYDVSVGESTNILSYEDFSQISEYAIPAMQYAAGSGIMKGRTILTLNPRDNTTRAEAAAMLRRFIEMNK